MLFFIYFFIRLSLTILQRNGNFNLSCSYGFTSGLPGVGGSGLGMAGSCSNGSGGSQDYAINLGKLFYLHEYLSNKKLNNLKMIM
jgi:hypothetical protein